MGCFLSSIQNTSVCPYMSTASLHPAPGRLPTQPVCSHGGEALAALKTLFIPGNRQGRASRGLRYFQLWHHWTSALSDQDEPGPVWQSSCLAQVGGPGRTGLSLGSSTFRFTSKGCWSPGPGLVSALIFRGEPGGFSLTQYSSPASVEAFFQQKPELL